MRRKPGALVPLEIAICRAALILRRRDEEFHGYEMARALGAEADARLLTAYGTLYRALGRLEKMGLLKSRWEDPRISARESRPSRRLYSLTALGAEAVATARRAADSRARARKRLRRLVPA